MTMEAPQFEIQPFSPAAAVPGAPVVELEIVQKASVVLQDIVRIIDR